MDMRHRFNRHHQLAASCSSPESREGSGLPSPCRLYQCARHVNKSRAGAMTATHRYSWCHTSRRIIHDKRGKILRTSSSPFTNRTDLPLPGMACLNYYHIGSTTDLSETAMQHQIVPAGVLRVLHWLKNTRASRSRRAL